MTTESIFFLYPERYGSFENDMIITYVADDVHK